MEQSPAESSTSKSSTSASLAQAAGEIPAADVEELIRTRAYLRAEQRGFAPGAEMDDWLAAEQEVKGSVESAPSEVAVH